MIDPHVHLRDWDQDHKETVKHGLEVAYDVGLDAVFEMPNTSPALTSSKKIVERIDLADRAISELKTKNGGNFEIFHGIYAGITADPEQIAEVAGLPGNIKRVVGLKMFAGNSTGNMGIINEEEQKLVYKTLAESNYKGVLAVHCEKESLLRPKIWDPSQPFSHSLARPAESEIESVKDQILFAAEAGYKGVLHIPHISVPESLKYIEEMRDQVDFTITCGLTPHHAILDNLLMQYKNGLQLKMNPALRSRPRQAYMLKALLNGRIDWIETDHAPHTLNEKTGKVLDKDGKPIYASGIPGLPFYPHFINLFKSERMPDKFIDDMTHNNITKIFGLDIPNTHRKPDYDLAGEYEFNAFQLETLK
ncbi:dihydroorotase [Candidatus Woesearchaeota archaeon]|nr:dihydroorotase [Candidatus Woesearchaeota archaeon]